MAHAHFMLNIEGYKHTLSICNVYCFSTVIMVERTRLIVTPVKGSELICVSMQNYFKICIFYRGKFQNHNRYMLS
jgi:hypothetical protein